MKLEGLHKLNVTRQRVYDALTDRDVLQRCIPGCELLERIDEQTYAAIIRADAGSMKGFFKGTVRLEDVLPPAHYRIVVEGKGAQGLIKGSGELELKKKWKATIVKYTADLQVASAIASEGSQFQATAQLMACQFLTSLEVETQKAGQSPPKYGFFRTFLGWLRR